MKKSSWIYLFSALLTSFIIFYGCKKNSDTPTEINLPEVTTFSASEVTSGAARIGGNVSVETGSEVSERGICWGTNPTPTLSDNKVPAGTGTGNFNITLSGLYQGTTYYVRAYATNSKGTAFGLPQPFTTSYLPYDYSYFPLAVWMQDPLKTAALYKANGINTFLALWNPLNEAQWNVLKSAGVRVFCNQNDYGLSLGNDTILAGWHIKEDEPDNAQSDGKGGYNPCIDPSIIISEYNAIKQKDPSRPVIIGLGQGVAYTNYIGRGACRNNTDLYKVANNGYLSACDIGSFDIYPVNNTDATSGGKLEFVAIGIQNLIDWSGNKPCWNHIETTRIHDASPRKPTPAEVRSEVWMSIIHGAKGIDYFCHSFLTGATDESALLHDDQMINAVRLINMQVTALAAVINTPSTSNYASVSSSNASVPVDIMTKNYKGINYIFASAMRNSQTTATFSVNAGKKVEVFGEGRSLTIPNGKFTDDFGPYAVHLYKITD
jgi:hypothetical protein